MLVDELLLLTDFFVLLQRRIVKDGSVLYQKRKKSFCLLSICVANAHTAVSNSSCILAICFKNEQISGPGLLMTLINKV